MDKKRIFKTIDEYIATLSEPHNTRLQSLREAIKSAAPEAVEMISYNMPAFRIYGKILVYFAAHTNHIGFYPAETAVIGLFKEELARYNTSKGTIQFQLDKPIPAGLGEEDRQGEDGKYKDEEDQKHKEHKVIRRISETPLFKL